MMKRPMGKRPLSKPRNFKPHLIVLDLSMAVMNGLTVGDILKETFPGTPLILFTSFGAILNSEDLRRAGFSALVGKDNAAKLLMTAQTLLDPA